MTIESITGRAHMPPTLKTASKTEAGERKEAASKTTEKADSIAITPAAQELKKVFESSSESTMDMERIAAIKQAIADGSYSVNAEKIAAKIIQFEKLLPPENDA